MSYQQQPAISWLVKDEASVEFHVKNDDYFGTMATLLSLLKQEIGKNNYDQTKIKKSFTEMEKDFMWLQNNYRITKKN